MSGNAPAVSVLVVSYNTRDELMRSLESLGCVTLPLETVVVDNGSADGSVEAVKRAFPSVRVIENRKNLGFARALNGGLGQTCAPYVLILNSDAEVRPGAVEIMASRLDSRPEVGVVGPRTVSADGAVQVSFGPELTPWKEWRQRKLVRGVKQRRPQALKRAAEQSRREQEPAWLSGSCMLARRAALLTVGGFDEGFFLYEEDVDLCLRVRRAGWRVLYVPEAEVRHRLGSSMAKLPSRAALEYQRSHVRFYRKHNGPLWTALLRLWLVFRSLWGWLAAMGPDRRRHEARRLHRDVLTLALRGR